MKFVAIQIITSVLLFMSALAAAEPAVNISYDYYDIEGRAADELRQQMNIHGVVWTNGSIYDAYTGWNVKWHYRYRPTKAGCSISSVDTTLNVEFRLPRWTNYSEGPPALKRKWEVYTRSLRQHENGHQKIGLNAAAEIQRSIAELQPAATCDELAATADELGRRILSKYAEKEKEYDAQTNFGATQGAVFP